MLFVNLDKMIIEDIDVAMTQTVETNITINADESVMYNQMVIQNACDLLFEQQTDDKPTVYKINLKNDEKITDEDFIGLVNLINAVFFNKFIILSKGRARERRLDIPDSLRSVHVSGGLLKRAINYATKCDIFNLVITYGNYIHEEYYYILADVKELNI